MRAGACLLTSMLLLTACERMPTSLQFSGDDYVVHSMLVAGATTADVLLVRMAAGGGAFGGGMHGVPVTGAVVHIVDGADTVPLSTPGRPCAWAHEAVGADGCYSGQLPGPIMPGGSYGLLITLPGGRRVTGQTSVPLTPVITEPQPLSEIEVLHQSFQEIPPIMVGWSGVAARTELRIMAEGRRCALLIGREGIEWQSWGALWIDVTAVSEARLHRRLLHCHEEERVERVPGRILVSAFDVNYAAHLFDLGDGVAVMPHRARHGVSGAWGVFGAVANGERAVELVVR